MMDDRGLDNLGSIRFALRQGSSVDEKLKGFAAIGTEWHLDRSKTCVKEIRNLMAHFGKFKYDSASNDFRAI